MMQFLAIIYFNRGHEGASIQHIGGSPTSKDARCFIDFVKNVR